MSIADFSGPRSLRRARHFTCLALICFALGAGCEDKPKSAPAAAAASIAEPVAPAPAPAASASPAVSAVAVDGVGVKVGFSRVMLDKPDGKARLREELGAIKAQIAGKELTIGVERSAKPVWVARVVEELAAQGVPRVTIKTETRKEFASELVFSAASRLREAPRCSVIAMILADRATAVWKLSGGVASRRARGFAGPDLTTTGETLERFAKSCKESQVLFVAAHEAVEWGLVFDLAASAKALEKAHFELFAILGEAPTPGRPVEL